jgi:hypothetical protein
MKRLISKQAYDASLDGSNFVIPGTPLYPQDYFRQRDPERLKAINDIHQRGEYLDFVTITEPTMTKDNPSKVTNYYDSAYPLKRLNKVEK